MSSSPLRWCREESDHSKFHSILYSALVPHHSMPVSAAFHPQERATATNLLYQSIPTSTDSSPSVETLPEGESSHPSPPTYINMCPMSYPETPSSEMQPTNASPINNHYSIEDQYALSQITPTFFDAAPNHYQLTPFIQSFNPIPQQQSPKWTPPTPPTNREGLYPEQCATLDERYNYHANETYIRQCLKCGSTSSSQWHLDATGYQLCDPCKNAVAGVSHISPSSNKPQKRVPSSKRTDLECSNCKSSTTSLWRRNEEGKSVCNACGLYRKLHKRNRPISMKKDTIQKRKRKPKTKVIKEQDQQSKMIKCENVDNSVHEDSSSCTSPCSTASHQYNYHQQMTESSNNYHEQIPPLAMLNVNPNYCNERLPPVPCEETCLSPFPTAFSVGSNLCAQPLSPAFNVMPNSNPEFPMMQQTNFVFPSVVKVQGVPASLIS